MNNKTSKRNCMKKIPRKNFMKGCMDLNNYKILIK